MGDAIKKKNKKKADGNHPAAAGALLNSPQLRFIPRDWAFYLKAEQLQRVDISRQPFLSFFFLGGGGHAHGIWKFPWPGIEPKPQQ